MQNCARSLYSGSQCGCRIVHALSIFCEPVWVQNYARSLYILGASVGAELRTISIHFGSQCGCRIVHDLYRFWDPGKKLLGTSDSRSKILLPAYTSLRDEKLGQNRCLQYMFLLRPPSIGFVLRTKHHRNNSFTVTHKQRAVCLPRPFVVLISSSLGWGKAS